MAVDIQLKSKHNRFFLVGSDAGLIAEKHHFKHIHEKNWWYSDDPVKANAVREYADNATTARLNKLLHNLKHSRAKSSTFEPCYTPEGYEFLPYQKAGIEWCLDKEFSIIGDDMGLGKTAQALGVANEINALKILIVCPASIKNQWASSCETWLRDKNLPAHIINSGKRPNLYFSAGVVIVNYDLVYRKPVYDWLTQYDFDLIIIDEGHLLQSALSNRTRYMFAPDGVVSLASKKIFLSGTPMPLRPLNMWAVLATQAPETLYPYQEYEAYTAKFCDAHWGAHGYDVTGSSNRDELNTRLRSTIMIRRMKSEVLSQLPEKVVEVVAMKLSNDEKSAYYDAESIALEGVSYNASVGQFVDLSSKDENRRKGQISKARKHIGKVKALHTVKYVKDILDANEGKRILLFAHHKEVFALLAEGLSEYGVSGITGDTPTDIRSDIVKSFCRSNRRVFLLSVTSAAGIDGLQSVIDLCGFVEMTWVPGEINQAIDRLSRMGQKSSVQVLFFTVTASLDESLLGRYVKNSKVISEVLD